jgi:hypothetical protein
MEEESGEDLDWVFAQWLHRTPSPTVDGAWKYNVTTKRIEIDLAQTQPGDAYRLPLEIGVDGTSVEKITQKQQHFYRAAGRFTPRSSTSAASTSAPTSTGRGLNFRLLPFGRTRDRKARSAATAPACFGRGRGSLSGDKRFRFRGCKPCAASAAPA